MRRRLRGGKKKKSIWRWKCQVMGLSRRSLGESQRRCSLVHRIAKTGWGLTSQKGFDRGQISGERFPHQTSLGNGSWRSASGRFWTDYGKRDWKKGKGANTEASGWRTSPETVIGIVGRSIDSESNRWKSQGDWPPSLKRHKSQLKTKRQLCRIRISETSSI